MLKYPCAKPKKNLLPLPPLSPHPAPQTKTIAPTRWALEVFHFEMGVPGTPKKRGVKLTPVTHLQYKAIEEGYKCPHFLA